MDTTLLTCQVTFRGCRYGGEVQVREGIKVWVWQTVEKRYTAHTVKAHWSCAERGPFLITLSFVHHHHNTFYTCVCSAPKANLTLFELVSDVIEPFEARRSLFLGFFKLDRNGPRALPSFFSNCLQQRQQGAGEKDDRKEKEQVRSRGTDT